MKKIPQSLFAIPRNSLVGCTIRLHWHRLWIRIDMSHPSLQSDPILLARLGGSPSRYVRFLLGFESAEQYTRDLNWRKSVARSQITPYGSERSVYFYSSFDLWVRFLRDVSTLLQVYRKILKREHALKKTRALSNRNL